MTHPDFQLPVQDCETDHGIESYDDLPADFGGDINMNKCANCGDTIEPENGCQKCKLSAPIYFPFTCKCGEIYLSLPEGEFECKCGQKMLTTYTKPETTEEVADYSGNTLEPAKVTELSDEHIIALRSALVNYRSNSNTYCNEILNLLESGCGVTVRNCNAQTQYEIDNA